MNLYATFYFHAPKGTLRIENLAQVMAHSFITLLLAEGLHPQLKWPNDILLNGKKISGVLCETMFQSSFVDIFLGIGINVNMNLEDLQKIDQPATSLKNETNKEWDRASLLKKLQIQFQSDLKLLQNQGFTPFHNTLNDLLAYKGKQIHCFDGEKEWIGICKSLTKEGKLEIGLPDGTSHELFSGDLL